MIQQTIEEYLKSIGGHELTQSDGVALSAGTLRVFELMKCGGWFSVDDICMAAGSNGRPAREGLRRARELRRFGFELEKQRIGTTREWVYRIVK